MLQAANSPIRDAVGLFSYDLFMERPVSAMMHLRPRSDAATTRLGTSSSTAFALGACACCRQLAALVILFTLAASTGNAEPSATPTAWTAGYTDHAEDADDDTNPLEKAKTTLALPPSLTEDLRSDRIWLINTRSISHHTRSMNLCQPDFIIERLDQCGHRRPSSLEEYLSSMTAARPRIIYVHGNRRDACRAITQGLYVYRQVACHRHGDQPFDWVIWSWPSEASAILVADAREKAQRTDSQGLYVAWLLREHYLRSQPTGLIGFSFGGRIVSGSLHALAGGSLGHRTIGEPTVKGANIDVGLLAPAVDTTWVMPNGQHGLASLNMNRLVLLYNHRDIALRFFKLISREPGGQALGYTGPRCIAPRYDGTKLPVRAFDCAQMVGNHHSEKLYYEQAACAGHEMGSLIESVMVID